MPLILRLTLVFCAAVLAGLYGGGMALPVVAVTGLTAVFTRSWLVLFAAGGLAAGALQGEARQHACWRFADGQKLQFTGVLESLPDGDGSKIMLRMLSPCGVLLSARLPRGVQLPPGREFHARGVWQALATARQSWHRGKR